MGMLQYRKTCGNLHHQMQNLIIIRISTFVALNNLKFTWKGISRFRFSALPCRSWWYFISRILLVLTSPTIKGNHFFLVDCRLTHWTNLTIWSGFKPLMQTGPTCVIRLSNLLQLLKKLKHTKINVHTCWPLHLWQCPGICCIPSGFLLSCPHLLHLDYHHHCLCLCSLEAVQCW